MRTTNDNVRGRFAPSPTGRMHLGNAWAALLAWLGARAQGGAMVLRVEDLDPERSKSEWERTLIDDLRWLGLDWDEGPDVGGPYGPYRQSERLADYDALLAGLEARGLAYPCYCTRKELRAAASAPHRGDTFAYPGTCRALTPLERAERLAAGRGAALRLLAPDENICFTDAVIGDYALNPALAGGDFALRRSDGVHAYMLAVVADDIAMRITQVVRGDDLAESTPRQILLYRLLGAEPPVFAHVPLLVDHEGERLAKRHASLSLGALREAGAEPSAVVGWLAQKAGLRERPGRTRPAELIAGFAFGRLPRGPIMVEENVAERILDLSARS